MRKRGPASVGRSSAAGRDTSGERVANAGSGLTQMTATSADSDAQRSSVLPDGPLSSLQPTAPHPAGVPLQPSLRGEWSNLAVLTGLYTLQGIPMGLASSIPLFLQSRGAGFADQATFGLSSWPYSLKLLWAPVVDALFTTRFRLGLRKSWIVPVQFVTGAIMLILGSQLNAVFGGAPEAGDAAPPRIDVRGLTASFFVLYFLVATQDIAVDGWALTMLRPENVGYASTANTVGQTCGIMLAYGLLMALDSPGFSNAYIRAPMGWPLNESAGVVSMSEFMQFWGVVFIASTLLLWALKREKSPLPPDAVSTAIGADAGGAASTPHSTRHHQLPVIAESTDFDSAIPIMSAGVPTPTGAAQLGGVGTSGGGLLLTGGGGSSGAGARPAGAPLPPAGAGSSLSDTANVSLLLAPADESLVTEPARQSSTQLQQQQQQMHHHHSPSASGHNSLASAQRRGRQDHPSGAAALHNNGPTISAPAVAAQVSSGSAFSVGIAAGGSGSSPTAVHSYGYGGSAGGRGGTGRVGQLRSLVHAVGVSLGSAISSVVTGSGGADQPHGFSALQSQPPVVPKAGRGHACGGSPL